MRITTTMLLPLIVCGGLLLTTASPASAHDRGYGSSSVHFHNDYRAAHFRSSWPRWLRSHHDFRRWYGFREHRFNRRIGWQHLYRQYRHDNRYHRRFNDRRRFRGRHFRRRHH